MPFVCVCRATQSLIFEVGVKDIVESVLDGYNGSIIASGQTGKDGLVYPHPHPRKEGLKRHRQ